MRILSLILKGADTRGSMWRLALVVIASSLLAMSSSFASSKAGDQAATLNSTWQGLIAYIGPDENLWTVHPDGTNAKAITSGGGVTEFQWSPRGNTIAYLSAGNLVIVRLDGSPSRTFSGHVVSFAWSPSGSSVAFFGAADSAGNETLFIGALDGSARRLPWTDVYPSSLVWAGDERVVYRSSPPLGGPCVSCTNQHLVMASLADTKREILTPENGWRWSPPVVTPDGQAVIAAGALDAACGTGGCQNPQIVRFSLDQVGDRTVVEQHEYGLVSTGLQLSESGTHLASVGPFHLSGCESFGTPHIRDLTHQVEVRLPGQSATSVGPSGVPLQMADAVGIAWAPRTDVLAVAATTRDFSRCDSRTESTYIGSSISIVDPNQPSTKKLTAPPGLFVSDPRWSPDGGAIAVIGASSPSLFNRYPPQTLGIYVWTLESPAPLRIADGHDPAWQPVTLPPVLFVPGCGAGPGTWTDTGWVSNTAPVTDVTSGAAKGRVLRGTLVGTEAVPAYILDYQDSPGTIAEVAGLLPASIDQIRSETGSPGIVLATHSMGGILAQYYTAGLSSAGVYRNDVDGAFMVAPPSRGSFLANIGGALSNIFACPQASELARNAEGIKALSNATPARLPYSVIAGTRVWLPFVGLTDGVVQVDDVRPWNVPYDIRRVDGTHMDPPALPNTIGAICSTVLNDPCVFELRLVDVRHLFLQRYAEAVSATAGAPAPLSPRQTPASPIPTVSPIASGGAVVSGTGDCLNVREAPSLTAGKVACLVDGTRVRIIEGPQTADGYTWVRLDSLGWAVVDFLQPCPSECFATMLDRQFAMGFVDAINDMRQRERRQLQLFNHNAILTRAAEDYLLTLLGQGTTAPAVPSDVDAALRQRAAEAGYKGVVRGFGSACSCDLAMSPQQFTEDGFGESDEQASIFDRPEFSDIGGACSKITLQRTSNTGQHIDYAAITCVGIAGVPSQ